VSLARKSSNPVRFESNHIFVAMVYAASRPNNFSSEL
jgi:hypothetical protein